MSCCRSAATPRDHRLGTRPKATLRSAAASNDALLLLLLLLRCSCSWGERHRSRERDGERATKGDRESCLYTPMKPFSAAPSGSKGRMSIAPSAAATAAEEEDPSRCGATVAAAA